MNCLAVYRIDSAVRAVIQQQVAPPRDMSRPLIIQLQSWADSILGGVLYIHLYEVTSTYPRYHTRWKGRSLVEEEM
jgi:hypothetical protein